MIHPMRAKFTAITIALLTPLLAGALTSTPSPPSPQEKEGLTRVLQARVADLLSEKNEMGVPFRRGRYSNRFTKASGAWHAVFHQETAKADTLLVERLLLTLAPDPSTGEWRIVSEQVQEAYDALSRPVPGDEEFLAFDAFSLEREGLRITSGPGFLSKDFRLGRPERLVIRAGALEYSYQPPLEMDRVRHALITEDHEEDFVFIPEEVELRCDPVTCEQLLSMAFRGLRRVRPEEIDEGLRHSCEEARKEQEKDRRQDAFEGFSLPDEPGLSRLSVAVKKIGRDHALVLDHDSAAPREVTLWVSGYGAVYAYDSERSRAGASLIDLERRPDSHRRDYDVEGIAGSVALGFGDGQVLSGDVTVRLRILRELRELPFEFARFSAARKAVREARQPRLIINSLQDGEGRDMTWVSTGPTSGLAVLPEKSQAGSLLTLRVDFENHDSILKYTPYYFYVARTGWLPFVSPGDMIQSFDLTVSVPARFKALGVGTKASEKREEDASITRWTSREAVNFPTVIFGGYKEAESKVKATKKDGAAIPVVTHVDRDSIASVAADGPQKAANQAAGSLDLYQRLFDVDYPYGKLDLVNAPLEAFSGQAPSSLIFIGSAYDPSVQRGLGQITKSELERFRRALIPHEVAHQWWGSIVGSASPRHQWFEEALAEYSAGLYFQAASGLEGYLTRVQDWRKEVIQTQVLVPLQDAYVLWSDGGNSPHASLYAKGPYVFHMMRSIWGDDRFFAFLKALAREHMGKEIVTRDIQRLSERMFGEKLDWFYDQWIRGVGIPEFTLRQTTRANGNGGHIIEGAVEQRVLVSPKLKPRRILQGKAFVCVAYLTVTGKSGKEYQHRLDIEGPNTPFTMTVPEKPKSIVLNKYGETLAHDVIVSEGN